MTSAIKWLSLALRIHVVVLIQHYYQNYLLHLYPSLSMVLILDCMYISKKIVEIPGGRIWVVNNPNLKGSNFSFNISVNQKLTV